MNENDIKDEFADKSVLVTGGAGFIGSHLVDLLANHDVTVNIFDNLSSGSYDNIEMTCKSKHVSFIKGDLQNFKEICRTLKDCQIVFHLAANPEVKLGFKSPEAHFRENIVSTFNLLEAIRATKTVEGICFTSSSTVYGEAIKVPTPEDYGPLVPISLYGAAKLASEALISSYAQNYHFRAIVCRLANIIGGRARLGVIPDFISKLKKDPSRLEILGDGTQTKSYLYIKDCIEGLLTSYITSDENVEIFNIGSNDRLSVIEIAKLVTETMGLEDVEFHCTGGVDGGRGWIGDVKLMELDISRLIKKGWAPQYNSIEAVKATAKMLYEK